MNPETRPSSGFGNHFSSEAQAGALPVGRNSPQRAPLGLVAELLSGSAFTAPRSENRRTWMYRRQPSVVTGAYRPYEQPLWKSGARDGVECPPDPLRWHPVEIPEEPVDFVDGLRTVVVNGDPDAQTGMAAHLALVNQSMVQRALVNADAEMVVLPQTGHWTFTTELGVLEARPGMLVLLPRGLAFRVSVDGPSRAYVCENYGAPFRLPELGPIGSNGLANPRDFQAPIAAPEAPLTAGERYQLIRKTGGHLWVCDQARTPFDVVAWHGNLTPYVYDLAHFMVIGSISFDHPDPSLFTVLTSPSDTPGTANCDVVVFPPRWLVAEDTFRPPWYHRNLMSEFMGLIQGQYDAKPQGFRPGGMSLHNSMVPHGPDAQAYAQASHAALQPHKLENTLAFMFESRWRFRPTAYALQCGALDGDYAQCWAGL